MPHAPLHAHAAIHAGIHAVLHAAMHEGLHAKFPCGYLTGLQANFSLTLHASPMG
jgi:hypothetical protein